jgi:hypothetical protein
LRNMKRTVEVRRGATVHQKDDSLVARQSPKTGGGQTHMGAPSQPSQQS